MNKNNYKLVSNYLVMGLSDSKLYPYVHNIRKLKDAVEIARDYPGVYRDGSATHICRSNIAYHDESLTVHSSWMTHRWRVYKSGKLLLDINYNKPINRSRTHSVNSMEKLLEEIIVTGLREQFNKYELKKLTPFIHEAGIGLFKQGEYLMGEKLTNENVGI